MESLNKMMTKVNLFSGNASSAGVACLFILTVIEIVCRRFFNSPTTWTLDIQELLQVGIALAGSSYVLMKEGHVQMNLILEMVSKKTRELLIVGNSIIGAVACGVMCWIDWLPVKSSFLTGEVTESASILIWPFKMIISLGFALLAIQFIFRTRHHFMEFLRLR